MIRPSMTERLPIHTFTQQAMATTFEIHIAHDDPSYAEKAAIEAFRDLERLEDELSRYRGQSDISIINQLKAGETFPCGLAAMDLVLLAKDVHRETGGAFDITVGPLVDLWVTRQGANLNPSEEAITEARARVGMEKILIDEDALRIGPTVDGLLIDLGGIGKGYALDQMGEILKNNWGCEAAFLNARDSTFLALAAPSFFAEGWPVTVGGQKQKLKNRALSGSGFEVKGGHIIDPRTARPTERRDDELAWSMAPYAALADALSTAFLVMQREEVIDFCARNDEIEAMFS